MGVVISGPAKATGRRQAALQLRVVENKNTVSHVISRGDVAEGGHCRSRGHLLKTHFGEEALASEHPATGKHFTES